MGGAAATAVVVSSRARERAREAESPASGHYSGYKQPLAGRARSTDPWRETPLLLRQLAKRSSRPRELRRNKRLSCRDM